MSLQRREMAHRSRYATCRSQTGHVGAALVGLRHGSCSRSRPFRARLAALARYESTLRIVTQRPIEKDALVRKRVQDPLVFHC